MPKAFDTQLPYAWSDLREREVAEVSVGAVCVRLGLPCAWQVEKATGRLAGVFGLPSGSAWTITAKEGQAYTLERSDGQARQTVTLRPSFRVVVVAQEG